jgi:ABC-2 type transport system ATP-binding protein
VIPAALEADRVTKRFGDFAAVDGLSLRIEPGEVLALLGPNGAGKTTLLKLVRRLLRPTSGRILVEGEDLAARPEAAGQLGYMSQKFALYPLLTGLENLAFFGAISGLRPAEIRDEIGAAKRRLPEEILGRRTGDVPPGCRQVIALLACLMSRPRIVLLDEPTSGASPEARRDIWRDIAGLKAEGRTILVTTHNLREAADADRVVVIDRGRVAADLRTRDLGPEGSGGLERAYAEAVGRAPRA